MHSTIEPRLATGQAARITVLRGQGRHLACQVTDVSANEYCVATQEPLTPGETIRLWSQGRRGGPSMIVEVRQCTLGEGHYLVGLERVDDRLGLLGSMALRDLFDRVPGDPPPPKRKLKAATFAVAAATVVLAVGVIMSVASGLIDQASAGQPNFIQAPVRSTVSDVPEPPPLGPSRLSLRATNLSWVTACADGQKLFERLFKEGDTAAIAFSETAIVRSGNAGGLELTLGGQPLGLMGPWGSIRMFRATPEGYGFVPPVLNDACRLK